MSKSAEEASTNGAKPLVGALVVRRLLCKSLLSRNALLALVLGQCLSLCISGTALTSALLLRYGLEAPALQSFLNYLLLALCFGVPAVFRRANLSLGKFLRKRGWMYALAALFDVAANYLVVKAYQFTSVTSVQVLDCLSIPVVLVISRLCFGVRFRTNHAVGVGLALLGVAGMIGTDALTKQHGEQQAVRPLLGDLLVVLGASLYGVSNCLQEALVRHHSVLDYLGFLGLFAAPLSGAQLLLMERGNVDRLALFTPQVVLCLAGFTACLFVLYTSMPFVMKHSSAVLVNLNMLTADLYALFFGLFIFHYVFHWLYFVAYVGIMVGVVVYVVREPIMLPPAADAASPPDTDAVRTVGQPAAVCTE